MAAASPGEVRVAAVGAQGLVDYAIWRPGAPDGVGDLHRGRITARMPALAGAFVALADADGFLPDSEGGTVPEGGVLGVRVTRAAQGGKGPRLSARLEPAEQALVGSGPPALLRRGPGAVERLAALHADVEEVLVDDAALAALLRPVLGTRLKLVRAAFDEAVETEVAALAEPGAALPGGAAMSVYPTPALTAIDVDLGAGAAGRRGKGASHDAANRAALPELARQIRLRNLGGPIVVDLAGLSPRRRAALAPVLAAALADDPLRPRLLGFTALGLAEILRPRVHPPLHELLAGPHAAGLAALRRAAAEMAAAPAYALALRAAPALVTALRADPEALAALAGRTGRTMVMHEDPALAPRGWVLEETRHG
ncbi:MAG: hypothetical protein BGP12_11490 [Rhodospirillales bacterium 70-18]|nr:MAG: hypothetical protein BGP12_11490 [Rhodospirillales bacterium 70-18]